MRFWKNAAILCCRQTSDWQAGGDSEPLREQQSDCCRHPQTSGDVPAFLPDTHIRRPMLLFCLLLCSSCHQQQVAGHELDVQHVAGVSSVQSHQLVGRAVGWRPAVGVPDVPHPN